MRKIDEENRRLDDVIQAGAGGEDDGLEVFEHLADLRLGIALHHLLGRGIERNLARDPNGVADPDGLRIDADGGRRVGRRNDLFAHSFRIE